MWKNNPDRKKCISNNKASTVLTCFLKGVNKLGLPSRARLHKARENVLVSNCIVKERGPEEDSMVSGPSTHNQRIERLWRDMFDSMIGLWY